jgi:hypothetical protein
LTEIERGPFDKVSALLFQLAHAIAVLNAARPRKGPFALAIARPGLGALVDQQPVALRFDQRDAELVAPQGERVAVDAVHPRAAEVERRAQRVVGPGAAAQAAARLEHGDDEARIVQQPRRDQPAMPAPTTITRSGLPVPIDQDRSRSLQHQARQVVHGVEQQARPP